MVVTFLNEKTGEVRDVKIGRSFTLLFFSTFFGIPLFLRKLNVQGVVILAVCLAWFPLSYSLPLSKNDHELIKTLIGLLGIITSIYFYISGNKLTALNYIRLGYKIRADKFAKDKAMREWWIPETAFIEDPQELKKNNEIA